MKIGILTLPLHTNYGGILQAYALQTVLKRMGHDVVVLQKERYKRFSFVTRVKHGIHQVLDAIRQCKMPEYIDVQHLINKKEFEYKTLSQFTQPFIDSYISCRILQSLYDIKEGDFDAMVVGSDQVWRQLYFTGMWDAPVSEAFLLFTKDWNIRRIAYAPSFGLDSISEYPSDTINDCTMMLKSFDAVSVREQSGIKICSSVFDTEAELVVDPTMLLDKQDYSNLIKDDKLSDGSMLTYVLDRTPELEKLMNSVSEQYQLKPFSVNSQVDDKNATPCNRIQPPVEQWLQGFRDAKLIFTDSFHACVFSIIFNKPFVVVGNKERGLTRFENLLTTFHQEYRLINSFDDIDEMVIVQNPCIDLASFRSKSIDFLHKALHE